MMLSKIKSWLTTATPERDISQQPLMSAQDIANWGQTIEAYFAGLAPSQRLSELSLFGDQTSRFRGQGMEYEESRAYQAGDELRHLNWRLMARTGKPSTKLFQEERQASWIILLDQRQSMRFATRGRLKVEQGLRLAGWLAWIAQRQGIRVQALGLSEQLHTSPTYQGSQCYQAVMQHLNQPCPRRDQAIEPNLQDVIQRSSRHWSKGSRIWLISDFADLKSNDQAWWSQMNHHWQFSACVIQDDVEQVLPAKQPLALASGGETYSLNPTEQMAYNLWAQQHDPAAELKRAGIECFRFMTDAALKQHPFLSR